ncbi:thermonuclease family protein [Brachybacterium sp. ACRRE]|uniref:thermonuclease family protein n=1 Tax=Brachybacterium sp. ACRRE TaxID=2918184 RepID=UPI001EF2FC5B|nr:thermonuclease family protein [Brachybacterium sp. ACRRE]MCG7308850.1 thermonuclease family protein [Brachybacterium sp. ACRRE]
MAVGAVAAVGITGAVAAFGDDDTRGEVVRVIDGDTLVARIDGDDVRVRLLNVDTPETKDPDEPVQCMGPEASAFLEKRLPAGTEIELEYDQERTDRYDRTLAAVFESGSLVNAEIAAEGLGLPVLFEPNDRFLGEVTRASEAAEREQKGLFAPSVECTLPAKAQQVTEAVDGVPAQVDGDPAEALGHAEDAVADADAFVVALDARNFSDLGNVVFATSTMTPYIDSLRERATEQRDSAKQKRSDLKKAKTTFDDRQTQESHEKEHAESEAQEEKTRQARASESAEQKSRSSQQERTTKKKATGTSSPSKPSSSSKRSPSNPSSAPKTPSSSKQSSPSSGDEAAGSSRTKSRSGSTSSGSSSSSSRSTGSSKSSSSKGSKGSKSSGGTKSGPKSSSSKGRSGPSSGSKRSSGSSSSGSSCAPYGPEIPYSNPGGYTGKRYGMPGGKTFRKCR